MAVLSQGDHNFIYAYDGVYAPEYNLWGWFNNDKCKTLISKPKIFVVQTYEGYQLYDYCAMEMPLQKDFVIAQCVGYGKKIFGLGR